MHFWILNAICVQYSVNPLFCCRSYPLQNHKNVLPDEIPKWIPKVKERSWCDSTAYIKISFHCLFCFSFFIFMFEPLLLCLFLLYSSVMFINYFYLFQKVYLHLFDKTFLSLFYCSFKPFVIFTFFAKRKIIPKITWNSFLFILW